MATKCFLRKRSAKKPRRKTLPVRLTCDRCRRHALPESTTNPTDSRSLAHQPCTCFSTEASSFECSEPFSSAPVLLISSNERLQQKKLPICKKNGRTRRNPSKVCNLEGTALERRNSLKLTFLLCNTGSFTMKSVSSLRSTRPLLSDNGIGRRTNCHRKRTESQEMKRCAFGIIPNSKCPSTPREVSARDRRSQRNLPNGPAMKRSVLARSSYRFPDLQWKCQSFRCPLYARCSHLQL